MTSLDEPRISKLSEVIEVLSRINLENDEETVRDIASLLRRVEEEHMESLLRILRMDFGEATRLMGTNILKKIVSEAVANITSLKQSRVEELIETGRIREAICKKNRILTSEGLSISQAYQGMLEACRLSGKGSISSKVRILEGLLSKSSEEETVFIINTLTQGRKAISYELIIRALEKLYNTQFGEATISGEFYEKVKKMLDNAR
ncbi:MAG: hypothetical protein NZ873_00280 [Crenarchaeota archaeon]|nr:hypothetical protein [Thermoproteota archaeon]MDW8033493.1 hypothetical protein [Nitrososphaerota archaeon]